MDMIVRVQTKKNKLGIVRIPSYFIDQFGHKSLNNVMLEDGTIVCIGDQDLEVVNDWPQEIEE